MGVYDRIASIQDREQPSHPVSRPPYYYRVPVNQLPGIGPKMYQKLLAFFDNEIMLAESALEQDIARVAGNKTASIIIKMRTGRLTIIPGGGGHYGKILKSDYWQ
jgi:PHP family Zn ribbon phosphoesterase